jgi:hypothetical protein
MTSVNATVAKAGVAFIQFRSLSWGFCTGKATARNARHRLDFHFAAWK